MVKNVVTEKEKTSLIISEKLIFIYLLLFPLGQLIKVETVILGFPIRVHPLDLIILTSIPIALLAHYKTPTLLVKYLPFIYIAVFSLVLSVHLFNINNLVVGFLYLIRLVGYFYFFIVIANYFLYINNNKIVVKKTLTQLIAVSAVTASIGWLQYIFFNDLRALKAFGWDDHLGRLAGSFLDPGYTGILLVLGALLTLWSYFKSKNKYFIALFLYLIIAALFTYSRAAYISFIAGAAVLLVLEQKKKLIFTLIAAMLVALPFLPRPSSEGVKLERVFSVIQRIDNYKETFTIIADNPLFGVGFNNMCLARGKYLNQQFFNSHSCSGSDSSLLFILATTGISGLIAFITAIIKSRNYIASEYRSLVLATFTSIIAHSFFSNSLFYSWVLGWFIVIVSISLKNGLIRGNRQH